MAIFNSLEFDGENSLDYGVYITGEAVYNSPERSVERISVPGRNGDLIIDNGRYENIEVAYPAGAFGTDQSGFASKMRDFRNMLSSRISYVRLTDTYHPDEFRLARLSAGLEVSPVNMSRAGEFDVTFDCKPQRFLTSGEATTTLTADGSITNPTLFASRPLITVTGNGTLTVNGTAIVISGTSNTVIDCDAMEIYDGSVNKSSDVSMSPNEFPTLSPGANAIEMTSGITKVEIVPRWWRL